MAKQSVEDEIDKLQKEIHSLLWIISNQKYFGSFPAKLHTDFNTNQMFQYIGEF